LTRDKWTSLSPYQPATGRDPYGLQNTPAKEKQNLIKVELEGGHIMRHANLLEAFFPNPGESQAIIDALGDKYGTVDRPTAKGPNGRRGEHNLKRGWKGMPKPPVRAQDLNFKEDSIVAAFVPIMNSIIAELRRSDTRVAVDRQNFPIPTRDGGTLKPDIFLWGKGSPAFSSIESIPPSKTRSKINRELDAMCNGQMVEEEGALVDWPWCLIPIEVKTDLSRGGRENVLAHHQLGTYVREVLAAQENRRFVPSLILTECTVEFLLWDRAGVIASERLDYHTEALLFCHILVSLITWDDKNLGFDPNVFYRNKVLHIRTNESSEYVVEETLVRSYTIQSRGSTCWRVRKLDEQGAPYLIQDSWVEGGMAAEETILRRLEDIRVMGCLTAIATLVHMEEVEVDALGPGGSPDTVKCNRRVESLAPCDNLVHTRTVLRCDSRSCTQLLKFATQKELVGALHDVIKGMLTSGSITSRDHERLQGLQKCMIKLASCIATLFPGTYFFSLGHLKDHEAS